MSQKNESLEIPKILKVNKDEHLFVLLDSKHHDKETMETFRKQLESKFPKLNNRVLIILGEGIQLAKV